MAEIASAADWNVIMNSPDVSGGQLQRGCRTVFSRPNPAERAGFAPSARDVVTSRFDSRIKRYATFTVDVAWIRNLGVPLGVCCRLVITPHFMPLGGERVLRNLVGGAWS